MRVDTEVGMVEQASENLATPLVQGDPIEEGTILMVLEKGTLFGSRGIVTQRNKGRGRVILKIGGVEVKMERHLLGMPLKSGAIGFLKNGGTGGEENLSAKDRRMLKMINEELVDPSKMISKSKPKSGERISGLRLSSNTLDIRTCNSLAEAQDQTMKYIEKVMNGKDQLGVIYISHGKSKSGDSIKPRYRGWIKKVPVVRRANVAELSDGGDAYTVVELHMTTED